MSHRPPKNRPPDNRGPERSKGTVSGTADYRSSPGDPSPSNLRFWKHHTYTAAAVRGLLLLAVALVFGQTVGHEFVNYDDGEYVYENQQVTGGLTVHNVVWAFTSGHAANWHPLIWLSHMLDYQLYGLHAGGHHLTNALLHAAAVILLFLVLLRMTSDRFPSAFVAAVFAIHPLRVESVAWVSERKDVLRGVVYRFGKSSFLPLQLRASL